MEVITCHALGSSHTCAFSPTPVSYFRALALLYTLYNMIVKTLKILFFHSQFWPIPGSRDSALGLSSNHHSCLRSCVSGSAAQDLGPDCLIQSQRGYFLALLNSANVLISLRLIFLIVKMKVTVIFVSQGCGGLNDLVD